MRLTSAIAIYVLFWWLCLFLVLPFRLRRDADDDEIVAGQAESAPPRFSVRRTLVATTIVSAIGFFLFYLNYRFGWIGAGSLDLFSPPGRR